MAQEQSQAAPAGPDSFSVAGLMLKLQTMPGGLAGNVRDLVVLKEDQDWPEVQLKLSRPLLDLLKAFKG